MTETIDYSSFIQQKGAAYKQSQLVSQSHYNDIIDTSGRLVGNSRIVGDASAEVQSRVIDILIDESRKAGLSDHQTAYVLAIARLESGFNPDAAAGTTSASGLGQFTNGTGAAYGLNNNNRWDVRAQARALVEHFQDNARLAQSRGVGEEYIYKYHHDGPKNEYGGLVISNAKIMPYINDFEVFVNAYSRSSEENVAFFDPWSPIKNNLFPILDLINNFERGYLDNGKECSIGNIVSNSFTAATQATQPIYYDPLALDLDNDGIETVGINGYNSILFDHNADGLKTATGWVAADDGLLALDQNGNGSIDNGRELFGIDYLKQNGQLASDGFDALRDLDANADNVFDANDAAFAQVRVWRDLNQDGASQANELLTLAQLNIQSIALNASQQTVNLGNGNQQTASALFTRTDGSTGTAGNLDFSQNSFYRSFADAIDTTDVITLPTLHGAGAIRDLREAAALSPALAQLLTDFAAADRAGQQGLLDQILTAWSDTSLMATTFTGAYAGHSLTVNIQNITTGSAAYTAWADKLTILEHFNGRTFNSVPADNHRVC